MQLQGLVLGGLVSMVLGTGTKWSCSCHKQRHGGEFSQDQGRCIRPSRFRLSDMQKGVLVETDIALHAAVVPKLKAISLHSLRTIAGVTPASQPDTNLATVHAIDNSVHRNKEESRWSHAYSAHIFRREISSIYLHLLCTGKDFGEVIYDSNMATTISRTARAKLQANRQKENEKGKKKKREKEILWLRR
ncbi:hypothetical protein GUJ93_ZPchr0010g9311 [Zizania palustris]|uniref:Uncharacterized protein n=1 Tax=Zizania palustris TaxID=103762 RepID=A0A8J5WA85_ZIZPA|nr:hypothetical protein GUJ93_ZPchr0010g9311 [Zizania palustris]